ncbi:helix-turn-helix domain-containing protein [Kibdelosporangium phytohabitans]|nr:helix-turn-helix transcriptional regulator [Kibdelosporangium phytohabitans]MBE1469066.1 transcriptional regulator with XRE-family HTH domain [Kibdelosporangium phytohabitans]
MSFGRLLREFRQRRDISQSDLARQVYVSQSTISRFGSGRQKPDQAC